MAANYRDCPQQGKLLASDILSTNMNNQFSGEFDDAREVCSVSELNQQLKQTIAGNFSLIWVEGEISNLARPASGHIYFSLKDSKAQLRCVMFRSHNSRVPFDITNGLQVIARASASVYEARGDLQLIVNGMEEAGAGALQRQFEALKKKLFHEGLFDEQRKKIIPQYPEHIAIVTSPTGAAIKDYLNVAQRRYPACKKSLYSVQVQGEQAAEQISAAINAVNNHADADIIVLIRGGGSIEDLWSFNDEQLARTIVESDIPIITGIGHEIDYTIADFVADLRAPTPSVAAELTCPDSAAVLSSLSYTHQQLTRISTELVQKLAQSTDWLAQRLQRTHPREIIKSQQETLNRLLRHLQRSIDAQVKENQYRFYTIEQRYFRHSPKELITFQQSSILSINRRLKQAMVNHFSQRSHQFQLCTKTMQVVSPLNTLQRGYSITVNDPNTNQVITNHEQLKPGDQITTYLTGGEVLSRVESTSSNKLIKSLSNQENTDM